MFDPLMPYGKSICKMFIEELPKAKQSTRFGDGHAYQDADVVLKEDKIRNIFRTWAIKHHYHVVGHAVFVRLVVYLYKGKANTKRFPTQRPDLENVEKLLNDALNNAAWKDDCLIVGKHVAKTWATEDIPPGYDLEIFDMEAEDDS